MTDQARVLTRAEVEQSRHFFNEGRALYDDSRIVAVHDTALAWERRATEWAEALGRAHADLDTAEARVRALEEGLPQRMVRDFHQHVGATTGPNTPTDVIHRLAFVWEETRELGEAMSTDNLPATLDALCDLLYVVYGTAVSLGIDLAPFFAEVHRSNMTKTPNGDGKAIKGPNYSPPNFSGLLTERSDGGCPSPDTHDDDDFDAWCGECQRALVRPEGFTHGTLVCPAGHDVTGVRVPHRYWCPAALNAEAVEGPPRPWRRNEDGTYVSDTEQPCGTCSMRGTVYGHHGIPLHLGWCPPDQVFKPTEPPDREVGGG